jgi:hypothetical protein
MEDYVQSAFQQLLSRGMSTRELIEASIEFAADLAVQDHAADGVMLDPDDAYDAILEGVRRSVERNLLDSTRSE